MSKKNNDFFTTKKEWSKIKDELLSCYLKPYIQKILHTGKPIIYVDCFAGKGVFDDGNPGSPIIALNIIKECIDSTRMFSWFVLPFFIELNHFDELKCNLEEYKEANVVHGKFEDQILNILANKKDCNVFLYIDPYGIKSLDCSLFDSLGDNNRFNSIELLINFNSFGFIREGCRVLGFTFENDDILMDLIEYLPVQSIIDNKEKQTLNRIAGGDYWIKIITDYKSGFIDIYEAESRFANEFCNRLRKSYKYVLNMPIRIKAENLPKYRMIHVTNHAEGCILMADNIYNRVELMRSIQAYGQQMLWEVNVNNEIVDEYVVRQKVIEYLSEVKTFTRMKYILADFFSKNGVICSSKIIKEIFKALEDQSLITVKRTPAYTKQRGIPSKFYSDEKGKITEMRWNL